MKHLKTFESYSINEEEGILGNIRKKFTGHESSDDKASAEKRINDRLAELEEKAKDGKLVFDKELLFKKILQMLIHICLGHILNGWMLWL